MTSEYKQLLRIWQYIKDLNQSDIYMYGEAYISSNGDQHIRFADSGEKQNYYDHIMLKAW